MLGVHEAVKQWNLKRGLRRGREEGRNERDQMFRKWFSEEKAKGSEGFREPPPFLHNRDPRIKMTRFFIQTRRSRDSLCPGFFCRHLKAFFAYFRTSASPCESAC